MSLPCRWQNPVFMTVMNVHPAYCALILKPWKGKVLKVSEGQSRNLTTQAVRVLVRCTQHNLDLCSSYACPGGTLNKYCSTVLRITTDALQTYCAKCRNNIRQYQRSWMEIAQTVSSCCTGISPHDAMRHIELTDHCIGAIVGVVDLGPGESTGDIPDDQVRDRTLATPGYLKQFNFIHALSHAHEFARPVRALNNPMPGLWKGQIACADILVCSQ